MFFNTYSNWNGRNVSRPKPSREIAAMINDLSKQKEDLVRQYQSLQEHLESLESSNELSDAIRYNEWLNNQKCFYTEHYDMLNHSIDLLNKSIMVIHIKICCIAAQIKSLKSDILRMKTLCSRRLSELNFSQVKFLTMRIQFAYDKVSRLEEKYDNLSDYIVEYNLLLVKLTKKFSLINKCKISIEDLIEKNNIHLKFSEDKIASLKQQISTVKCKIDDIDKKISFGNNRIVKNKTYYAMRQEYNRLAYLEQMAKREEAERKRARDQEQFRRKQTEDEIQRMRHEEDELTKTIEEEERKLAERKKKLIEMQSNIAKKRDFLGL